MTLYKGLFAWVLGQLAVQPKIGLSFVLFEETEELFKFSLTKNYGIMHVVSILRTSPLNF